MNQDKKQTKSDHGYFSYLGGERAARLAQLRERQSAERDVADWNPGRINPQGLLLNNWKESTSFVMISVTVRLSSLLG